MSDWAGEYFGRGYAQRWGVLPVTDNIRRETRGLWRHLQLGSRARVLDLGCGNGSLNAPLRPVSRGSTFTGSGTLRRFAGLGVVAANAV